MKIMDKLRTSEISHDPVRKQFKLEIDKFIAVVDYESKEDKIYLTHSEVPYHLQGKGYGKELIEKTFEYIDQHNIKAVAVCSYIKRVKTKNERWNKRIG